MQDIEDYLTKIYYTLKSPASYTGAYKLWRYIKDREDKPKDLKYKNVKNWLATQVTHNIHTQSKTRFKRQPIIVPYPDYQYDADLIVAPELKKYNSGYSYILLIIDLFSRYAWGRALKKKTGDEVKNALQKIFEQDHRKPYILRTDRGLYILQF